MTDREEVWATAETAVELWSEFWAEDPRMQLPV
jgi:hypothetical protein